MNLINNFFFSYKDNLILKIKIVYVLLKIKKKKKKKKKKSVIQPSIRNNYFLSLYHFFSPLFQCFSFFLFIFI